MWNEIKKVAAYVVGIVLLLAVGFVSGIYFNNQRAVQRLETERLKWELALADSNRQRETDKANTDAAFERQRLLIASLINGTAEQSGILSDGAETQRELLSILENIGSQSVILEKDGTWSWSGIACSSGIRSE